MHFLGALFKSLARCIALATGIACLVFFVLHLVPGDPVELMLGETSEPRQYELLRAKLGLDRPMSVRFHGFLKNLVHGDLGTSIASQNPVARLILEALPYSLLLAVSVVLLGSCMGIPLGVLAAHSRKKSFQLFSWVSIVFVAIPSFWLAPLLVLLFSFRWPWLPVSSFDHWSGLVLPTLTLGLSLAGYLFQTTRVAVNECLSSDYIRTAYAKGLKPSRVLFRHALPNAIVPVFTVTMLQFGHLLAGTVVIETLFNWPGMGKLLHDAVLQRDYPVVQGTVLITAMIYVAINSVTDFLNRFLGHNYEQVQL
ncbi:MAG: ABC transporter permease [Bdellovibrionota bacterium]